MTNFRPSLSRETGFWIMAAALMAQARVALLVETTRHKPALNG